MYCIFIQNVWIHVTSAFSRKKVTGTYFRFCNEWSQFVLHRPIHIKYTKMHWYTEPEKKWCGNGVPTEKSTIYNIDFCASLYRAKRAYLMIWSSSKIIICFWSTLSANLADCQSLCTDKSHSNLSVIIETPSSEGHQSVCSSNPSIGLFIHLELRSIGCS